MTADLLLIGLVIAFEPLPLTGYLLVLSSDGGLSKGFGFVLGWVVTLVVVVGLTLALTGGKPVAPGSAPSQAALIVKIVLGAGLLGLAWWQQRRRGRPRPTPSWMGRIDGMSVWAAAALGFLLQPWPLVAAGAASVVQADLSEASSVATLIAFLLLATTAAAPSIANACQLAL